MTRKVNKNLRNFPVRMSTHSKNQEIPKTNHQAIICPRSLKQIGELKILLQLPDPEKADLLLAEFADKPGFHQLGEGYITEQHGCQVAPISSRQGYEAQRACQRREGQKRAN